MNNTSDTPVSDERLAELVEWWSGYIPNGSVGSDSCIALRELQQARHSLAELEKQLRHASLWSQELDDERKALNSRLASLSVRNAELEADCESLAANGDKFLKEKYAVESRLASLSARNAVLEKALNAGFVMAYGHACFKTSNGVPMGMPVKAERIVRAALAAEQPAQTGEKGT